MSKDHGPRTKDQAQAHRAVLRIACGDAARAERLRASLTPDDDGHLAMRVEADALVLEAGSDTPLGLLRTLDEAVAQLAAAQKADALARG